ncbi:Cleavage and polyadenylation specificity factor subunit 2 [Gossypium arboreum]|uniref:Cleavage and polyadenylation specificity factor subunit 2 n=1 Tax=Gossypium arboreum TaxID=29729 RepID=A0A0B0PJK9_GOSAR|nr:Cleavage and polyadenylation specificity factor subunit 2 [Gossypium arboreum]
MNYFGTCIVKEHYWTIYSLVFIYLFGFIICKWARAKLVNYNGYPLNLTDHFRIGLTMIHQTLVLPRLEEKKSRFQKLFQSYKSMCCPCEGSRLTFDKYRGWMITSLCQYLQDSVIFHYDFCYIVCFSFFLFYF